MISSSLSLPPTLHLSLVVDMFSDPNFSTLPYDIPCPLDAHPDEDPLAPLNFDDLLDIAREFEFTRTITHIWPCEELSPCTETGLEDILAAIAPTPNAEESPLPLPSPTLSIPPDPVQEVDLHRSVSMCPPPDVNASISKDPAPLLQDDDQVQAEVEHPITSILRGWSPPDGSQFLDLDDSLMFPQPVKDMWISPWLASFLVPSYTEPARSINQLSGMVDAIGDVPPQASATKPKAPPVGTIDKAVDNPRQKTVPFVPLPAHRAILESVRADSSQANVNVPGQMAITPYVKTPKSRVHLPSTPATGGHSTAKYAKAPRGGIPPHIARTVTKANILRIEKERKVMQDAFSSATTGEGKKPSVLRRAVRTCGGSGGKNPFDWGDDNKKEGRAAKRARV